MRENLIIAAIVVAIVSLGGIAFAEVHTASSSPQGEAAITFPIPELGNCTSKNACKVYCSDQAHFEACISFGESHGLMKSSEATHARIFATMKGPGGCMGETCKAYCDISTHVDECLAFAQAHGLVRAEDVKIVKLIRESGGPGQCKSETECQAYCSDSTHRNECQKFAEDNGFATGPREGAGVNEQGTQNQSGPQGGSLSENQKIQELLATSGGPGGCKSESACRAYCNDQGHVTECLQFGKDHGLISQKEYDRAEQFTTMTGPGGCTGEECKAYCDASAHIEECLKFGEQKGFINKADAENARKVAGKPGPGGCTGEACKTYCADQSHQKECVSFAVDNGFMTQAEADRMQQNMQNRGEQQPGMPGTDQGQYPQQYQGQPGSSSAQPPQNMTGQHESRQGSFNQNNATTSEIHPSLPAGSGDYRNVANPGGCKTPEECAAVCKNNPEQCKGFQDARDYPPAKMTPEQQKQYNANRQNYGEQQLNKPETDQVPPQSKSDMQQHQGQPGSSSAQPPQNMSPEQQRMYDQYQRTGTSPANQPPTAPARSLPQETPPPGSMPPPPPAATSSIAPSNFVAAAISIFARLLGF